MGTFRATMEIKGRSRTVLVDADDIVEARSNAARLLTSRMRADWFPSEDPSVGEIREGSHVLAHGTMTIERA